MRLLAITEDERGPATRYRVAQFLPALQKARIEYRVLAWPRERRARGEVLDAAGDVDVVLLQRRLIATRDFARLRARARRLAFDFDDALPFRDSSRGATRSLTRRRRFAKVVGEADLVIAGNAYLATLVPPSARRLVIVPTAVPTDRFRPGTAGDPATLGWIGSRSTLPYLESVLPALPADEGLRLRVVSNAFPTRAPIPIDAIEWRERDEPDEISRFGIGLAPLPEDVWTRGKCGLRVLLYFAAGVPVVASPVGVQADMVSDGITGLRATSPSDFAAAIARLRADAPLRRACAAAGRQLVEDQFSLARVAPLFVAAVRSLA
ncbi:MAG: glycosyltransferase family 4 protein [Planctomycetes bacterium]|nr:glycosyltransferase family 4 protein [Planctomycetota bacterium]MBI3846965.1 glycosyltransferase family 4 protein [Planctomycetota bacterium]